MREHDREAQSSPPFDHTGSKDHRAGLRGPSLRPLLEPFPLVLFIVGLAVRISPLFDLAGRNLRQFIIEDGYLMLTIARNIALGRGMSIADGSIPTNGTQPLLSLVYAGGFWLVGGDKAWGVWVAQVLQIAISVTATIVFYRLGSRLLAGHPDGDRTAAVAAGLWFAASRTVGHSQNGLETAAYTLTILLVVSFLLRLESRRDWSLRSCAQLGALLGVAFWVRNDASLAVIAICAARLAMALPAGFTVLTKRIVETTLVGATAFVLALPWLVYNKVYFGHFRPISGIAEASSYSLGENLVHVPVAIAEYVLIILPIPRAIEGHPLVIGASVAITALAAFGAVALGSRILPPGRRTLVALGCALGAFAAFYGLLFGVGFFITRYFFPFSPFLALNTVYWARTALATSQHRWTRTAVALATLFLVAALNVRLYDRGLAHQGHFQAVEWLEANVDPDVWIGAIQTGTTGFFHDRTINLDGKVNPYALEARLAGRTQEYVLETDIQYVVDWVGIESWLEIPAFRGRFELRLLDRDRNLVVLERVPIPEATAGE